MQNHVVLLLSTLYVSVLIHLLLAVFEPRHAKGYRDPTFNGKRLPSSVRVVELTRMQDIVAR